jgi:hypothetical protein
MAVINLSDMKLPECARLLGDGEAAIKHCRDVDGGVFSNGCLERQSLTET